MKINTFKFDLNPSELNSPEVKKKLHTSQEIFLTTSFEVQTFYSPKFLDAQEDFLTHRQLVSVERNLNICFCFYQHNNSI